MSYPNSTTLALRDLSFSIHSGEFVFVIGQSGSGKSTIVKLLTCEEKVLKGNIFVGDYRLNKMKRRLVPYLRRNIGMVFQDFRLIPTKTIFENVAFAMEILGYSRKAIRLQVSMVLSTVGLRAREDAYPNELSGGEQQRVAIARAMVNNPAILLADEPTGNLDPANSETIMALLEEINRSGTTVVICTHNRDLVNRMKKRVIEIDAGSLVRDDESSIYGDDTPRYTPRELKRRRGAGGGELVADEDSLDDEEFEIPEFARGILHMDDYIFDQDDYPEDSEEDEVSDAPYMSEQAGELGESEISACETSDYHADLPLEELSEQDVVIMSDELTLAELSRAVEARDEDDLQKVGSEEEDHQEDEDADVSEDDVAVPTDNSMEQVGTEHSEVDKDGDDERFSNRKKSSSDYFK